MKDKYLIVDGRWKKANKWMLFKFNIKNWFKKWKLVNTYKYKLIPTSEIGRWFGLSEEEYKESERLYKNEQRTISYEFYPCGGIGYGVRIHDLDTDEVFDITDVSTW